MGIFHCHVSFRECKKTTTMLVHFWIDLILGAFTFNVSNAFQCDVATPVVEVLVLHNYDDSLKGKVKQSTSQRQVETPKKPTVWAFRELKTPYQTALIMQIPLKLLTKIYQKIKHQTFHQSTFHPNLISKFHLQTWQGRKSHQSDVTCDF